MADLHVTTLCIAPARTAGAAGAAGSVATKAADAGAGFDFSMLFAGAMVTEAAGTAPQEEPGKETHEEPKPEKPGKAEKPEKAEANDVVQLLGLPVPAPQVPAPAAPEVVGKPAGQVAAAAPDSPKPQPKADAPALKEKDMAVAPEPVAAAEPRKEIAAARPGDELRMLAQVHESQPAQGTHAARPALPVAAPVGTPQWREEFSAAVRVIATEQIQSAEIHLHPPELGPVQVSLRMEAREANIAFSAPHADTRQALEAALPRLRELLEAGGISLGSTSVDISGSGAFGRDAGREPGSPQAGSRAEIALPETAEAPHAALPARSPRLLDVFA